MNHYGSGGRSAVSRSRDLCAIFACLCVAPIAAASLSAGRSSTDNVCELSGRLQAVLCEGRCPCQQIGVRLRTNVFADVLAYADPDVGVPCAGLIVLVWEWRSGRQVTTEMFIDSRMDGLARLSYATPEDEPVLDDTYSTVDPDTREFSPRNLMELMTPDDLDRLNSRYAEVLRATLQALTRAKLTSTPADTV